MGKSIRDLFFKIDARSLGLFRIAMAIVLVLDVLRRYTWVRDFASNEGVIPNHNHIFVLKEQSQVWSVLHAFSSPDENRFAYLVILCFYLFFLVGYRTRVFHVLSIVGLVSLSSRNVLTENAGTYAAVALLAVTVFLPLGKAFSLDSLRASFKSRNEKTDDELNDRSGDDEAIVEAGRGPGWSPMSIASIAVLVQIGVLYWATARAQSNDLWKSGDALYYAIHQTRLASSLGASLRAAPPGLLSAWTMAFHYAEYAIPVLLLVPVAPRWVRGLAASLSIFVGLTVSLLFALGMYGWTLVAASALLLPRETWEKAAEPVAKRARTVIYDSDCGICLWLARLLKRLDVAGNVTFVGNAVIQTEGAEKPAALDGLPAEVNAALVEATVVVLGPDKRAYTKGAAIAAAIDAVPLGGVLGPLLRLPGISHLLDAFYAFVAPRRARLSELFGMAACGVPSADGGPEAVEEEPVREVAPATRVARRVRATLREIAAAAVLAAILAQAGMASAFPKLLPQAKPLQAITAWPRMLEKWDALASVSTDDEYAIVDALTRNGKSVDLLTGAEPSFDLSQRKGSGLGQLWNDFLYEVLRDKEYNEFQRALRDYFARGGPRWDAVTVPDNGISGYDVYWIRQSIPAPGSGAQPGEPIKEKLFTHSRGGKLGATLNPAVPLLRPAPPQR